jgi:hypothetical protein
MPVADRNKIAFMFFVVSMIVTTLFLLNMFVGVIVSSFMIEKEKLKQSTLLTKLETDYVHACILCYQ